jgi:predicted nucleotidyltransferase
MWLGINDLGNNRMKKLTPEQRAELVPERTILCGYRGSVAHNMYVPNTDPDSIDDIDLMGVFMAPKEHYIGISRVKETQEKWVKEYDTVNYEFMKFVHLLLKSNPNVMAMLWLRPNHYIHITEPGQILVDNKEKFVSKIAYKSFTGYAYSQLKRMEKFAFNGYMGKKRKALVDKFGYDCKNAAHCIRLLRMGMEFLVSGELNVFRDDAPMLLDIKRGKWSLEEVKAEAKRLFVLADEAYVKSSIPERPDRAGVEKIVKEIMMDYLTGDN